MLTMSFGAVHRTVEQEIVLFLGWTAENRVGLQSGVIIYGFVTVTFTLYILYYIVYTFQYKV